MLKSRQVNEANKPTDHPTNPDHSAKIVPLLSIKSRVEAENGVSRVTATIKPFHFVKNGTVFGTILGRQLPVDGY
jgi:hypothetical protein